MPLTENQINKFKSALLEQKEKVINQIKASNKEVKEHSSLHADPIDQASQVEFQSQFSSNQEFLRTSLKNIENTLERINSRDFGYCEECGEDIDLKRLEVNTTALFCFSCQNNLEQRSKMYASDGQKFL